MLGKQRRQSERSRRRSRVAEESLGFEIRQPQSQVPEHSRSSDRGRKSSRGKPQSSGSTKSAKSHGSGVEIDLSMECYDEPLSQCQIDMAKKASDEYTKSLELIAAARSGRLVYLPNGKTKILDHPFGAIPELQPQKAKAQARPQSIPQSPVVPVSQVVPKDPGRSSPDIIFVGETPPAASQPHVHQTQEARKPIASPKESPVVTVTSPILTKQSLQTNRAISKMPFPGSVTSAKAFAQSTALASLRTQMQSQALAKAETDTQKKRSRKHPQLEGGGSGNWVPLDEYYYGKTEGNPAYHESKGEYRFKCSYCNKMLYNNIAAMLHVQGHIDSDRQVNLDITDLTQCKHCFKQFDTPFEMQTHIEKVHMNNTNVLLCRICEKDHESRNGLKDHMKKFHNACEMPYICNLCHFRSSMYSDVVDHFKKKHTSSEFFLCLYCLRVFHVRFIGQGWGQTNVYYNHLLRHQAKNSTKKCQLCKLIFLNAGDLKEHRRKDHEPNQKGVIGITAKYTTPHQVMIKLAEPCSKPNSGVKSLNVKSVCNVMQHTMIYPSAIYKSQCIECRMIMGIPDHYKQFIHCSMCRFASSCSFAYANHMMGFHSGQLTAAATRTAMERPLDAQMYCSCGFVSSFGNRIANHLVSCSKRSCYSEPPALPQSSHQDDLGQGLLVDPRKKPGASLLDVLGLVKKNSVQRSKPVQAESPPPSPVEMPEVDLQETPPRRPSLLKGSMKKSFKDILKHTFEDVKFAQDASSEENEAEQMPTLTPCKVVLTNQDVATGGFTASPPKIEMAERLPREVCGRKRTKIMFHTEDGAPIVDKTIEDSSLTEDSSEMKMNLTGVEDVDKVEDDIPPLVKEVDFRTEDGSNDEESQKIPELEKFEPSTANKDEGMSSGDERDEEQNMRESVLPGKKSPLPKSPSKLHKISSEKDKEYIPGTKIASVSGSERENVFEKFSLSLSGKEVKEGACVFEDGNKLDREEKSMMTEEDGNKLDREEKSMVTEEDGNKLDREEKSMVTEEDGNKLDTEEKPVMTEEDGNKLDREEKSMVTEEDGNKLDTEEKPVMTEEDGNKLDREEKSMVTEEDGNKLDTEEKPVMTEEDGNKLDTEEKPVITEEDGNKLDTEAKSMVTEATLDKTEVSETIISCEGEKMEELSTENPPDLLKEADLDESSLEIPESCVADGSIPVEANHSIHQVAHSKENDESIPDMETNIYDEETTLTSGFSAGVVVDPNIDDMPRLSPMVDDDKGELKSTTGIEEQETTRPDEIFEPKDGSSPPSSDRTRDESKSMEKLPRVEDKSEMFVELEQAEMTAASVGPAPMENVEEKLTNDETEDMECEDTVEDQRDAEMLEDTTDERESSSRDPSDSREVEAQWSEDKPDDCLKTEDEPGNKVQESSSSLQGYQETNKLEGLEGKTVVSPFSIDGADSSSSLTTTEKSIESNVTEIPVGPALSHEESQSQKSGVQTLPNMNESQKPVSEERPKQKEPEFQSSSSSSHTADERERSNRDRSNSRERSRRDRDGDRHRDRDRHRDYDRNRDRDRDRDRERHRDRDRYYDRDRARDHGRDRSRDRDRYRDRSRNTDRERDRSRDRERDSRDRGRERDRSRDRDRYRDRERKYRDERSYR